MCIFPEVRQKRQISGGRCLINISSMYHYNFVVKRMVFYSEVAK